MGFERDCSVMVFYGPPIHATSQALTHRSRKGTRARIAPSCLIWVSSRKGLAQGAELGRLIGRGALRRRRHEFDGDAVFMDARDAPRHLADQHQLADLRPHFSA